MKDITDNARSDVLRLIEEVESCRAEPNHLELAVIDLIIGTCHYSIQKLSTWNPLSLSMGALLLNIELECIRELEKMSLPQESTSVQNGAKV